MPRRLVFAVLGLATLVAVASSSPPRTVFAQSAPAEIFTIFDNGNIAAVRNRPTRPTEFELLEPTRIVTIKTYHWNNGRGSIPGTIAVRSMSGETYGPWQAAGEPGQGGVPNAYWAARPNADLPAGQYTVIDSNPSTWAQNSLSGGAGFASAEGHWISE